MFCMRDPSEEYMLTVRTFWEVNDFLNELAARAARDRDMYQIHKESKRKKPTRAALATALLLHLKSLPIDRQNEILRDGMRRFNLLAEGKSDETPVTQPEQLTPVPVTNWVEKTRKSAGKDRKSG